MAATGAGPCQNEYLMAETPLFVNLQVLQWIHWKKQTFVLLLQIWPPPHFLYSHTLYSSWHQLLAFSQVLCFCFPSSDLGAQSHLHPFADVPFLAVSVLRVYFLLSLCSGTDTAQWVFVILIIFHTVWGAMNLKNKIPFSGERRHLNFGLSLPPTKDVCDSLERAESSVFVVAVMPFVVSI